MRQKPRVFLRQEFVIDDTNSVRGVWLNVQFDDGLGIWINGGGHIPKFSSNFPPRVIDWLLAHPKP